jgi:hypothetical protein
MSSQRRPSTRQAMYDLIQQAQTAFPFHDATAWVCQGDCQGCSLKILTFLHDQLEQWRLKLNAGTVPTLGDVADLGRLCHKVARVFIRNGIVIDVVQKPPSCSDDVN